MSNDLSMEAIQERLDELEKLVKDSEGDADRVGLYWGELRHLRQVYDRMIMDSQGLGIQMMQDIMERNPTTRENYTEGVAVASTEKVLNENPTETPDAQGPCAPATAPAAPANITINVTTPKEEAVEPTFDERVVALMRSDRCGADVQIPIDTQITMEKAKKSSSSIDGIDQEKIGKMHKESDKKKDEEDEDEESETPETKKSQQDSFYRSETDTIQKALLYRDASLLTSIGRWAHKTMQKSCMLDNLSKAIRLCFEKAAGDGEDVSAPGSSLLAGMKARAGAKPSKNAYAQIVACNAKIQDLQEQMQDCSEPDKLVEIDKKLRAHYQHLSLLVMGSEGLGLKTEDMIRNKPDTRFPKEMTKPVVGAAKTEKSQSDDLEKSRRRSGNRSGKIGNLKFVITFWDAEGGLNDEQARAVVHKVASTDKSISRRLKAKLPPLKKMRNMDHLISLNGDADAPIPTRSSKSSRKRGRDSRDAKSHSDRRVGSANHPGRHVGVRHIVRGKK